MHVVVLSDTHLPKHNRALPASVIPDLERADLILHAGDFATFEILNMLRAYAPVLAVHGNVDEPELRRVLPRRLRCEVLGRPLGMIHGDGPSGSTLGRAQAAFAKDDVDLVIFGHSHQPLHLLDGEKLFFNPGSPTDRRTSPRFTYGRLFLNDEGRLDAELIEC